LIVDHSKRGHHWEKETLATSVREGEDGAFTSSTYEENFLMSKGREEGGRIVGGWAIEKAGKGRRESFQNYHEKGPPSYSEKAFMEGGMMKEGKGH